MMKEMTVNDWKFLCQELLLTLENEAHAHWVGGPDGDSLIERARASLAESDKDEEFVMPSDEELLSLMPQIMRDEFASASRQAAKEAGIKPGIFRVCLNTRALEYAQLVLTKYGNIKTL